jgi:hypothetical protein
LAVPILWQETLIWRTKSRFCFLLCTKVALKSFKRPLSFLKKLLRLLFSSKQKKKKKKLQKRIKIAVVTVKKE